jgi:hypothetical protein
VKLCAFPQSGGPILGKIAAGVRDRDGDGD